MPFTHAPTKLSSILEKKKKVSALQLVLISIDAQHSPAMSWETEESNTGNVDTSFLIKWENNVFLSGQI